MQYLLGTILIIQERNGDGITKKKKSFLFEDKELLKYFSDILQGTYKIINKEVYFITKKNKKQEFQCIFHLPLQNH